MPADITAAELPHLKCPLCESSSVNIIERVPTTHLANIYKRNLGISVVDEFGEEKFVDCCRCVDCDLCFFYPMVCGSEVFYEELQKKDFYYLDDKNEYEFAKQYIKPTYEVLEIGCGKGAFLNKISAKSRRGLEFSKKAQQLAMSDNIEVINESIQDHCLSNAEAYDAICSFQVLEHVEDIKLFIGSAVTCLKKEGLLILSTPSSDSFSAHVTNFILDMPPHHVTRWSDVSIRNIAKIFDLKLVELWHEPLQEVHRVFYAETVFFNVFSKLLHRKYMIWDDSLQCRAISFVSRVFAKIFAAGLVSPVLMPRGISVTAVFRKE